MPGRTSSLAIELVSSARNTESTWIQPSIVSELLIHIAHHVGVRAEEKINAELMKYVKKVMGKAKLLYKLAKAVTAEPEGVVREVIYPVVSEETLEDVIREAEADEKHEQQVKLVTRSSYSHHYRRVVPVLLNVLSFQCNNERHRPVMDAVALLEKHRGRKSPVFPFSERVPLDDVVKDDWQDLVKDDKHAGAVNRISYEWCVLTTLREKLRCKEVWGQGRAPLSQSGRGPASRLRHSARRILRSPRTAT